MNALESLNTFFNPALVSEMRAGSATVETNIPLSAVAVNSSSCGGTESRSADNDSRSMKRDGLSSGSEIEPSRDVARGSAKRDASCGGYGAGVASGPQDSISVSAISAEGVAAAGQIPAPGPVPAVASNPIGPRSLPTGPTTRRDDTGETIVASPAAFSFQPDFEKLFNEIMGQS